MLAVASWGSEPLLSHRQCLPSLPRSHNSGEMLSPALEASRFKLSIFHNQARLYFFSEQVVCLYYLRVIATSLMRSLSAGGCREPRAATAISFMWGFGELFMHRTLLDSQSSQRSSPAIPDAATPQITTRP